MFSFQVSWFILSLTAMLSFACMALTLKKLTYLLPTPVLLFYVLLLTSVITVIFCVKKNFNLSINLTTFGFLLLASILAFIGNITDIESMKIAPNPGYASAVKSGQIVLITCIALLIFPGQKLSMQGISGVLLIFAGVALLALQK